MVTKDNLVIKDSTMRNSLTRLTNQIYKLLPSREEGENWEKPLQTIIIEVNGLFQLFPDYEENFFPILCKLEGLFSLQDKNSYFLFRRMIFDILALVNGVFKICQN